MKRKWWAELITDLLITLLVMLAAAAVTVALAFDRVVIVQDTSWKLTMPRSELWEFRKALFKRGAVLEIRTLDEDHLKNAQLFEQQLSKHKNAWLVLCSPVITARAQTLELDVSNLLWESITAGIGISNSGYLFDMVLVSDTMSGWAEAEELFAPAQNPVDALHKSGSAAEEPGPDPLQEQENAVTHVRFAYTSEDITRTEPGEKWVTDYRLTHAVEKGALEGVVCPDLALSVVPLLDLNKYSAAFETGKYAVDKDENAVFDGPEGFLFYEYRKAGQRIF